MKKIVLTQPMPEECLSAFEDRFELVASASESEADIAPLLADADALISVGTPISAKLLAQAGPQLKAVGTCTLGYDHIDLGALNEKRIGFIHCSREIVSPTSEIAVGLILAVMRGIPRSDRGLRKSLFVTLPFFPSGFSSLFNKTAGLIGFGRVGKRVAKILRAMDMNICYTDVVRASREDETSCDAAYLPMDELLKTADLVSVHCPYTPESHHLINKEAFMAMKPTAYFVNGARGKIVDEAALVWALENGEIAGAALDVYEHEPHVTPRLAEMENVVMTSHIGTCAYDVRMRTCIECLEGVAAVLDGKTPYNLVNRELFV